jgi:tol-pal system protein YbgF
VIPSIGNWRGSWRFLGAIALALSVLSLIPSAEAQQGGEADANRINRLEKEFQDLQVSVGTLESLLRSKPGALLPQEAAQAAPDGRANSAAIGDLTSRVGALETQIGALTNQLERLSKELAALKANLPVTASVAPAQRPAASPVPAPPASPPVQQSEAPPPAPPAVASTGDDPSKPRWYGSPTDVPTPADNKPQPLNVPGGPASDQNSQVTAAIPSGDAQSLYEQGYGSMLQHDYGTAEAAFRQLVASHPNDPLAGSAQYWIGESYYVRGQYKNAADAFLKGYKKYKGSDKAPDTLLKLAMSLAELGQKDAACSTFSELAAKFPNAPDTILDAAKGERKKTGC